MVKKMVCLLLCMLLCAAASAEETHSGESCIPADAQIVGEETWEESHMYRLRVEETGEEIAMVTDASGSLMYMITTTAASIVQDAQSQDRKTVEEIICQICPDARIVFSSDGENGVKLLTVVSRVAFGQLRVQDGKIISRNMVGGVYIEENGMISMDGALHIIRSLHPEVRIVDMEIEDGEDCYEGEAWVENEKLEFRLDAYSGRLLKWERD